VQTCRMDERAVTHEPAGFKASGGPSTSRAPRIASLALLIGMLVMIGFSALGAFPGTTLPHGVTATDGVAGNQSPTVTMGEPIRPGHGPVTGLQPPASESRCPFLVQPSSGPRATSGTWPPTAPNPAPAQVVGWSKPIPPTVPINFTEQGLATGANWSVSFNGVLRSTNTATLVFATPNGTYRFTVSPMAGYSVAPATGTLVVAGRSLSVDVAFESVPATRGESALVTWRAIGIAAGVLLLTAIALAVGGRGKGQSYPPSEPPPIPPQADEGDPSDSPEPYAKRWNRPR
jgi:hypothetical protein